MKRLMNGLGEVFNILDQIILFGALTGDASGIGLLERICPDQKGGNLTRKTNNRNGIKQRIG